MSNVCDPQTFIYTIMPCLQFTAALENRSQWKSFSYFLGILTKAKLCFGESDSKRNQPRPSRDSLNRFKTKIHRSKSMKASLKSILKKTMMKVIPPFRSSLIKTVGKTENHSPDDPTIDPSISIRLSIIESEKKTNVTSWRRWKTSHLRCLPLVARYESSFMIY